MNWIAQTRAAMREFDQALRARAHVSVAEGRALPITLAERRSLLVQTALQRDDDVRRAARTSEIQLRALSSEETLRAIGVQRGFRIEDLLWLELARPAAIAGELEAWWRRRLLPETQIDHLDAQHISVRAAFAERGEVPTSQRKLYAPEPALGGRVRVEAFELHVTEHCNLRCAHCCNSSPYLPEKTLEPAAIARTLATMSQVLHADVFKIMGGEPLLHPQITEVVRVVRESGVADVVRLFTNGLLLSRMDDDFWRAIDQLTVSSYSSAQVKPAQLARIEDKAREFDVVLNVKPVSVFSQVMHDRFRADDEQVARTWQSCWLRHRCLVAREGRFYLCTRAAYLTDLHARVALHEPFADPERRQREDSIALDDPALAERLLALLNREEPLHSCRFCLGGDGPREAHTQLTREDVRAGRLHRLPLARP